MGFVIAVLLTLAMAGSVLWVMPSAREKALSEMRQKALQNGVRVRLLDEKTAAKLYPWLEDHRGLVNYELPLPAGRVWKFGKPYALSVNQEKLHELDRDTGLWPLVQAQLDIDDLPDSTEALTFYSHAMAILWREKEGVEAVELVCKKLKAGVALDLDRCI